MFKKGDRVIDLQGRRGSVNWIVNDSTVSVDFDGELKDIWIMEAKLAHEKTDSLDSFLALVGQIKPGESHYSASTVQAYRARYGRVRDSGTVVVEFTIDPAKMPDYLLHLQKEHNLPLVKLSSLNVI
jgi:hypothetical protein